jgi:hypothetical protein
MYTRVLARSVPLGNEELPFQRCAAEGTCQASWARTPDLAVANMKGTYGPIEDTYGVQKKTGPSYAAASLADVC